MILHCVFCKSAKTATAGEWSEVMRALADLTDTLSGASEFQSGPNRDFENKSSAYREGFVITFADRDALETYAQHPTHLALGERLCDLCEGGAEGIIVFDLETT